jgi:hypothetical protein
MEYVIAICGFLGAWLLFAGPVYQAALELREEQLDQESFESAMASVPPTPKVSRWWWLLPPVAWAKQRRLARENRDAIMAMLDPEQREQAVNFLDKASGWIIVASGALLLGVKETWSLTELLHLPLALFWILVVVAAALGIVNAIVRMWRRSQVLQEENEAQRRNRAKR